MPVAVLLVVAIVLSVALVFIGDRAVKAIRRALRLRDADRRLTAAKVRAEDRDRQRRAAVEASAALTSVMPTIHDLDPRHVE
jgi:type II secretory pathway pseudopilin PulG